MKYNIFVAALVLSLFGAAQAAQEEQAVSDADSDIRATCIETAVADEVEEGEQFDKFVEECVQEAIALREKSARDKS